MCWSGSCAQIGARVHLSAGVLVGGVLEPPGARPVIVEDEAFVGAGARLLDGVLVGRGAVIAAGVILTGTSRLYDLVRGASHPGHAGASRSSSRRAPSSCPGTRPLAARSPQRHGLSARRAVIVKDRDARTDRAGRARGGAAVSRSRRSRAAAPTRSAATGAAAQRDPARRPARRARPGGARRRASGRPFYVYDLDVIERQVDGAAGRAPAAVRARLRGQGEPVAGGRRPPGRLGLGADVASGGELAARPPGGVRPATGS